MKPDWPWGDKCFSLLMSVWVHYTILVHCCIYFKFSNINSLALFFKKHFWKSSNNINLKEVTVICPPKIFRISIKALQYLCRWVKHWRYFWYLSFVSLISSNVSLGRGCFPHHFLPSWDRSIHSFISVRSLGCGCAFLGITAVHYHCKMGKVSEGEGRPSM